MDTSMMIEIFGYIGSTLVVVSMLMSSVVKLRIINTTGSIISGTYALIIGSFPLALMNFSLIVINLYNLYKLLKSDKQYDLVKGKAGEAYLEYFLKRYREDIRQYFPEFEASAEGEQAYIVCCDGNPAGLLLGEQRKEGVFNVALDYTTPLYRDCSVGKYLYEKLSEEGVHTLVCAGGKSETHSSYLDKMGFVKEKDGYVKKLK